MFTLGPSLRSGGGDPYIGNVVLLHRFDGNNVPAIGPSMSGAPSFTSVNAFAGQSMNAVADCPRVDSALMNLPQGDFTIEAWVRASASQPYSVSTVLNFIRAGQPDLSLVFSTSTMSWQLSVPIAAGAANSILAGGTLVTGQWVHVAATRQASDHRLFVNGILLGTVSAAYRWPAGSVQCNIGNNSSTFPYPMAGLIDEVRLTAGVARYTANFTPPVGPFPSS